MAKKTTYKKWTTEYRKRHAAEYNKENYDSFLMKIPKGAKEQIREAARRRGVSMTAFIMSAALKEIADEMI